MIETWKVIWGFRRFFGYAALLILIGWLWVSKTGLERDLAECHLDNKNLWAKVEKQNEAITAFEKTANDRKKVAETAMKEARVVEKKHADKATRILVSVPRDSDECVAALELLKEYQ